MFGLCVSSSGAEGRLHACAFPPQVRKGDCMARVLRRLDEVGDDDALVDLLPAPQDDDAPPPLRQDQRSFLRELVQSELSTARRHLQAASSSSTQASFPCLATACDFLGLLDPTTAMKLSADATARSQKLLGNTEWCVAPLKQERAQMAVANAVAASAGPVVAANGPAAKVNAASLGPGNYRKNAHGRFRTCMPARRSRNSRSIS